MSLMKRVCITGAEGRLGSALAKHFDRTTDYEILTSDLDVPVDDIKQVIRFVSMNHPNIIINCAALSDVEYCENNPDEAYTVNALGARNLAIAARKVDAKLIHVSTDDIFNSEDHQARNEFDKPNPTTIYGKSKAAGEELIMNLHDKHVIIRSSWLYGYNYDHIDEILQKAKNGEKIVIKMKQYSTPTTCKALVDFITSIMDVNEYGVFHASCEGSCRRVEFIKKAIGLAGYEAEVEVLDEDMLRPTFSVLDNMMLRITGVYKMPSWEDDLKAYIQRRKERGVL